MSEEPLPDGRKEDLPFADATLWVSRIMSMIAPGLLGLWLDDRFGTRYLALVGLVLGLTYAVAQFVQMSRKAFRKSVKRRSAGAPPEKRDAP